MLASSARFSVLYSPIRCTLQASGREWHVGLERGAELLAAPRLQGKTGAYKLLREIESGKLYRLDLTKSCLIFTTETSQSSDALAAGELKEAKKHASKANMILERAIV